jgi:uncharacterized protein (TIGR00725 family)
MTKLQIDLPTAKQHARIQRVAIFGSADVDANHPLYLEVFNAARTLAYHDKLIVDGGGPGVMDAATKGAQSAGGKTLTVTFAPENAPFFEGKESNNIADREIKTANYIERMFTLIENADIFLCFQGGTGTLSEWTTAWLLSHIYYGNHKPLILYGDFWRDVMVTINEHFFIGATENETYRIVDNPEDLMVALDIFETELQSRSESGTQQDVGKFDNEEKK